MKNFALPIVLGLLLLPACSSTPKPSEESIAQAKVNALVKDAEADTFDTEVKDYTVADYQGFNPNGIVVHFDFEKADLTPAAIASLNRIVAGMKKDPLARITIKGHTDKQGTEDFNAKLSSRRAQVIRDYLLKHGIEPERLDPVAYGATEPVDDAERVTAYKKNRRGDFNINYGPSAFGPSK